jgi:hypothetical protein
MAMVSQHYCIESLYVRAPISHIFIYFPPVPLLRYYFSFSLVPLFTILSSYLWRLIYGVFWLELQHVEKRCCRTTKNVRRGGDADPSSTVYPASGSGIHASPGLSGVSLLKVLSALNLKIR